MLHLGYVDIHEDLKESYARSRHLHRSISKISNSVNPVDRAEDSPSPVSPKPPKLLKRKPPDSIKTAEASPKKFATPKKLKGKAVLNNRLQALNYRLIRTKAGKSVSQLPDLQRSPALDRVEKLVPTSPSEKSFWGNRNLSLDAEWPRKLPHISLLSGKVRKPLALPTYSEYCDQHKIDLLKAPASEKAVRKASVAIERMEKLKRQINGLSVLLRECPGIRWNHDRKVLYHLDKHPEQRANILKSYASRFLGRKSVLFDAKGLPEGAHVCAPQVQRSGVEAARVIKQCKDEFSAAQAQQSQQLIDILDRYEVERPFFVQRKMKCIAGEGEQFKDIGHAMQRFSDYRRETEEARRQRIKQAEDQSVLYEKLLEYLKLQPSKPSEAQLQCLETVKGLLEEGWVLDIEVLGKVREALGTERGVQEMLQLLEDELRCGSDNE